MNKYFALGFGSALALVGALAGCVEPYVPEVLAAPSSYLVVDGFINGNGRTTVLLMRTASVAATGAPAVEKGAKVFIVDDAGTRYALAEPTAGTYRSDSLVLSPARRYQVRLTTAANAAYESDLVPLKVTPPIDKLGWQQANRRATTAGASSKPGSLPPASSPFWSTETASSKPASRLFTGAGAPSGPPR
jgi:hypothetical protein